MNIGEILGKCDCRSDRMRALCGIVKNIFAGNIYIYLYKKEEKIENRHSVPDRIFVAFCGMQRTVEI